MRLHILAAGTLLLSGCHSRRAEPAPMSCTPTAGSPTSAVSAEGLAGTYRLMLVATVGSSAGQSVEGALRLQPHDSAMRVVTIGGVRDPAASYILYGSTDVKLEVVDAVRPGDLGSEDPLRPGVLVVERKGTVTLRLGSEANRRDVARFDGGYTALRVRETAPDRFAGRWTSGLRTQRSAGHFCAVRVKKQ